MARVDRGAGIRGGEGSGRLIRTRDVDGVSVPASVLIAFRIRIRIRIRMAGTPEPALQPGVMAVRR